MAVQKRHNSKHDPNELFQRMVCIGDIHGEYSALVEDLVQSGLMDKNLAWLGKRSKLIQMGDIIDRGDGSVPSHLLMTSLQKQAETVGGTVIRLCGNHELMAMIGIIELRKKWSEGNIKEMTPETAAQESHMLRFIVKTGKDIHGGRMDELIKFVDSLILDVLEGSLTAAHCAQGYMFIHGGLRTSLRNTLLTEMAEANIPATNMELANHMNDIFRKSMETGDMRHPLFNMGARCGMPEDGGIFWSDYDLEIAHSLGLDPDASRYTRQVVGHTPEGMKGSVLRHLGEGRVINIDTGHFSGFGNNIGYLEVIEGKAVYHYKDEGHWTEVSVPWLIQG